MRILILNQTFYPDLVSTAQHATDLAVELARRQHDVVAVSSRRAYDNPAKSFPRNETWNRVNIIRLRCTGFGKRAKWARACDFGSYFVSCFLTLLQLPRFDVVIAMTSPPLISLLAAWFIRMKGGRLVFWVMDLNPDEAVAAGWLAEGSWPARYLKRALHHSLSAAERIVVMDRFMRERILGKGVPGCKIDVIPPWSHDRAVRYDHDEREAFRAQHGLAGKFVVMYSGNHSPCHPLNTLLDAAKRLSHRDDITFCFVGGGSEFGKVKRFVEQHSLPNVVTLPYQPLDRLSGSLSAADLHTVVLGDPFVGIVHPCKVYNILALGIPLLYIGPPQSHITDLLPASSIGDWAHVAGHADSDAVVASIVRAAELGFRRAETSEIARCYSDSKLIPQMCSVLESPSARRDGRLGAWHGTPA